MARVKGTERRPFIFTFRLHIALHDVNQVDEILIEIEGWKQSLIIEFRDFGMRFLNICK